jgi:hypothetical protein
MYAGLETRMTAALESGATKTQFADKLLVPAGSLLSEFNPFAGVGK